VNELNWVDVVMLALLANAGISGLMKGFIRSIRPVVTCLGGFAAARYVCTMQPSVIDWFPGVQENVSGFINSLLSESFQFIPIPEDIDAKQVMEMMQIPSVLQMYLGETFQQALNTAGTFIENIRTRMMGAVSNVLTYMTVFGIFFLGSWLLAGILIHLLMHLIMPQKKKRNNTIIKLLDRLCGLIAGICIEGLILMGITGVIYPIAFASEWGAGSSGFLVAGVQGSTLVPWLVHGFQNIFLPWIKPLF
jgi:uncharacterized membrane protein required for colicin V production